MKTVIGLVTYILALPSAFYLGTNQAHDEFEIRVRLIDAHSGKAFAKTYVHLFGVNTSSGPIHGEDILLDLTRYTGSDGVAHFSLSRPLPYRLLPENPLAGCASGPPPPIITEDVLKSGYLRPNDCARKSKKVNWQDIKAEPGQIVLFGLGRLGQW